MGEIVNGSQAIAVSWLTFAAVIASIGSVWFGWFVLVPVLLAWVTGIYFILRRRRSR